MFESQRHELEEYSVWIKKYCGFWTLQIKMSTLCFLVTKYIFEPLILPRFFRKFSTLLLHYSQISSTKNCTTWWICISFLVNWEFFRFKFEIVKTKGSYFFLKWKRLEVQKIKKSLSWDGKEEVFFATYSTGCENLDFFKWSNISKIIFYLKKFQVV